MTDRRQLELPDSVELRQSPIHGSGIFATQSIPRGTRILEYVGERICKTEGYRRAMRQLRRAARGQEGAVYIFEVSRRWDLDGNVPWNPARFINHSCRPNCETRVIAGRVWIYSIRRIRPGEELSYDYGYDIDFYLDHPCRCGAPQCVGFIVRRDQWPKLRRLLGQQPAVPALARPA
ncbi:MAG: SET domain-containing protein-lysine N-methyltransferase [Candidatus Methylacidiphilales bacterium]